MLQAVLLSSYLFFCGVSAQQGEDMSDEDFSLYLNTHENAAAAAAEYSNSFGRGCVKGGVSGAITGRGLAALCIGCAVGGASEVAAEMAVPREIETNRPSPKK